MKDWLKYFDEADDIQDNKSAPCCNNSLAFDSSFKHKTSGLGYNLRHIPVLLHFESQDKSGKKRKAKDKYE